MAFPPRFGFIPGMNLGTGIQLQYQPTIMVPTPQMQMFNPVLTSMGPRSMKRRDPPERYAITTAFVGNISERASNDLVKQMLVKCGNVVNWKRVQGSDGKFQAFGFCEFDHPESTLRALRILHDFQLGEKRLVVKVDEKTKKILLEYVNKARSMHGHPPVEDIPSSSTDEQAMLDHEIKGTIKALLAEYAIDCTPTERAEEGEIQPGASDYVMKQRGKFDEAAGEEVDDKRREYIESEITRFREAHKEEKEKRAARKANEKGEDKDDDEEDERSSASGTPKPGSRMTDDRSTARSPSPAKSPERERSRSPRGDSQSRRRPVDLLKRAAYNTRKRSRSPSHHRGSTDDEDQEDNYARKKLEKRLREKEASYQERLRKWESRERKKTRDEEKTTAREKQKKKDLAKEIKKLKEFFEDYDDERDDQKYYKGSVLAQRRRAFETEKAEDAKDRLKEKQEIEELRKKLVDQGVSDPEKELVRIQQQNDASFDKDVDMQQPAAGTSKEVPVVEVQPKSRSPSQPVRQGSTQLDGRHSKERRKPQPIQEPPPEENGDIASRTPSPALEIAGGGALPSFRPADEDGRRSSPPMERRMGFGGIKLQPASGGTRRPATKVISDVEEKEEEGKPARKLVPIDYTDEEKRAVEAQPVNTADEKKRMIKSLIERIPTAKSDLFKYAIDWEHVDDTLIRKRLRPWVNKKIIEYIGEEEPSLVDFVCEKVVEKVQPQNILADITMILDDEAEVFVVKMWRLLIYEIEAKKIGLVKSGED